MMELVSFYPMLWASFITLKKRLLKKIEEDNKKNKNNIVNSSTPINAPVVNRVNSIDEHRNHIVTTLNHWSQSHRDDLHLKTNAAFEENIDYRIEFKNTRNGNETATIICGCGSKAVLNRINNTRYFQVSIYVYIF